LKEFRCQFVKPKAATPVDRGGYFVYPLRRVG
jgi:hypothetical protein